MDKTTCCVCCLGFIVLIGLSSVSWSLTVDIRSFHEALGGFSKQPTKEEAASMTIVVSSNHASISVIQHTSAYMICTYG